MAATPILWRCVDNNSLPLCLSCECDLRCCLIFRFRANFAMPQSAHYSPAPSCRRVPANITSMEKTTKSTTPWSGTDGIQGFTEEGAGSCRTPHIAHQPSACVKYVGTTYPGGGPPKPGGGGNGMPGGPAGNPGGRKPGGGPGMPGGANGMGGRAIPPGAPADHSMSICSNDT